MMHSTKRAALRFALGRLRQSFPRCREQTPAATWLYSPHAVDHAMRAAMIAIAAADPELHRAAAEAASHVSVNAWIVRVCLYLRAVLREDEAARWDEAWGQWPVPPVWPRMKCSVCGERRIEDDEEPGICGGRAARWQPARPLWTQAPSHGGRR